MNRKFAFSHFSSNHKKVQQKKRIKTRNCCHGLCLMVVPNEKHVVKKKCLIYK